jgi:hypothetical protein
MSDIVERLRQQATVEAKKFGDARDIQIEWRAAEEIERLRARVEVLECVLRDARHNGLIYWEPQTTRGAVQRANMMSRIDIVLNKEAQP